MTRRTDDPISHSAKELRPANQLAWRSGLWNHGRSVGQHLHAADDYAVAGLDAVQHHVVIADDVSHLNHSLPGHNVVSLAFGDKSKDLAAEPRYRRDWNHGRFTL